uniref:Uncharacterized protein n=1 Tax=Arundo donax TaxID=35708 RepID=A0A0A9EPF9_ARUDO
MISVATYFDHQISLVIPGIKIVSNTHLAPLTTKSFNYTLAKTIDSTTNAEMILTTNIIISM